MIEVKHLYKSFGDKEVLKDINAVFEDGKTNLIIGQSGSGKTVLMKNLVGLLTPTSGEVLYDGRNFVAMTKQEKVFMRREMGMIFQSAALFDSLNVLENVMFPLDMFSSMNYRERVRRAQECLDRVNLGDAQLKYPGEISGGMQKRVAIARAIALQPKYLFCDEPNSGLDPKTSLVIDDLIHDIIYCLQLKSFLYFQGIHQQIDNSDSHHRHSATLPHSITGNSHGQRKYRTAEQPHNHQSGNFIFLFGHGKQCLREYNREHIGVTETNHGNANINNCFRMEYK